MLWKIVSNTVRYKLFVVNELKHVKMTGMVLYGRVNTRKSLF